MLETIVLSFCNDALAPNNFSLICSESHHSITQSTSGLPCSLSALLWLLEEICRPGAPCRVQQQSRGGKTREVILPYNIMNRALNVFLKVFSLFFLWAYELWCVVSGVCSGSPVNPSECRSVDPLHQSTARNTGHEPAWIADTNSQVDKHSLTLSSCSLKFFCLNWFYPDLQPYIYYNTNNALLNVSLLDLKRDLIKNKQLISDLN